MERREKTGEGSQACNPQKAMKKGILLTEVLIYLAMFTLVLNFVFAVYYRQEEFIRRSRTYSENLREMLLFQNFFTSDVNNSLEMPDSYMEVQASETTLLLKQENRLVIYRFEKKPGLLTRQVENGKGKRSNREWKVYCARFERDNKMAKSFVKPGFKGRLFEPGEFIMAAGMRNGR